MEARKKVALLMFHAVLTPSYAAHVAESHDLRDSSVRRVLVAGYSAGSLDRLAHLLAEHGLTRQQPIAAWRRFDAPVNTNVPGSPGKGSVLDRVGDQFAHQQLDDVSGVVLYNRCGVLDCEGAGPRHVLTIGFEIHIDGLHAVSVC